MRAFGPDMATLDAHVPTQFSTLPTHVPQGLTFHVEPNGVVITRRWLRGKHFVFLLVIGAGSAWVANEWQSAQQASGWLIFATLFCVSWCFNLLGMFLNSTTVRASHERIDVSHGPIPSLFARRASVARGDLRALFSAAHGAAFAVQGTTQDGTSRSIVAPLATEDQARFVAQQLQKVFELAATVEQSEASSATNALSAKASRGLGAFALIIPLFVGGVLFAFFSMAESELAGELRGSGELGSFSFAPTDCSSGQREGFGGVSLTAEGSETIVRVVNDPIKGQLLVVARPGTKNHVIDGSACSRFSLRAARTDTNINDIWVVEGGLDIACPELSGQLTFDGCW
jgi:hypothetical protein